MILVGNTFLMLAVQTRFLIVVQQERNWMWPRRVPDHHWRAGLGRNARATYRCTSKITFQPQNFISAPNDPNYYTNANPMFKIVCHTQTNTTQHMRNPILRGEYIRLKNHTRLSFECDEHFRNYVAATENGTIYQQTTTTTIYTL